MRYLLILLVLSGCVTKREVKMVVREVKKADMGRGSENNREPGSLWSEQSHWNQIYASTPSRMIGDIVLIKPAEALRRRLVDLANPGSVSKSEKAQSAKKETKRTDEGEEEKLAKESKVRNSGENADIGVIAATIKDLVARDVYLVQSVHTYRLGSNDYHVDLVGNIRDRDIAADETAISDALFNLHVESTSLAEDSPKDKADAPK
ncbi:MAG: flagellar basal body L-ring protein FlgH [Deltaproteobacteria bacterium]|nr:flagellar basal body L-ring protein FlgH [Deltaproteobacteria bacterium]